MKAIDCIKALQADKKWHVELNENDVLSDYLIKHRAKLPAECVEFISKIKLAMTELQYISEADGTVWVYTGDEDRESWVNEFKKLSLDSASGDERLINDIEAFWANHLVILISVFGNYAFHAVDLDTGKIVHGSEPEFEEVSVIAENFEEWFDMLASGEFKKYL